MFILNEYLSYLFEQGPQVNNQVDNKAVIHNPNLYSILGGIKVDLPTFNIFRTITINFQNSSRRCETLEDLQSQQCICSVKMDFLRRQVEVMRRGDRLCATQKDPFLCRNKIRAKMLKNSEQIKKLQQKILTIRVNMMKAKNKETEKTRE